MKKLFSISALLIILAIGVTAQSPVPKIINGGVVNGKALSLPKPVYPAEAAAAKVSGQVKVEVLIDEAGKVVSATALSGLENVSLRQAAEAAAILATFSPTKLSGQPVKVKGVITYDFVAEKSNKERVKPFAVSAFLAMARFFTADLQKFNEVFERKDFFSETAAEFPEFAELSSLKSLEKMTAEQRTEAIDKAAASVRGRLSDAERWQFEVGEHFGALVGSMMKILADNPDKPEFKRLDASTMKVHLGKIKDLTLSAPEDFPKDVLQRLGEFARVGERDDLVSPAGLTELGKRGIDVMDSIKPDLK